MYGDKEVDRILKMTEKELRAEIEAEGQDWDEEIAKVKSCFELALADVTERTILGGYPRGYDPRTGMPGTLVAPGPASCGCRVIHTCGFTPT